MVNKFVKYMISLSLPKTIPLSPLGDPEIYSEISVESISFNKNTKQEDSEQSWASWLNPRKSFNTNLPLKKLTTRIISKNCGHAEYRYKADPRES